MNAPLVAIACITLVSAAVAMTLRNLIHSALLLIASWAGVAAFYLWAGAEFVAFAQVLVYVGAVSMVVLFAVLLTRRSRDEQALRADGLARVISATFAGGAVLGVLFGAIAATRLPASATPPPAPTVRVIGTELMGPHVAAVLVVGLILTVSLLGAVVLAATGRDDGKPDAR